MEDVLEHLGEVDPFALADPASIERLQRQLARLEATLTKAVAAFDASGAWAPEWGAHRLGLAAPALCPGQQRGQ